MLFNFFTSAKMVSKPTNRHSKCFAIWHRPADSQEDVYHDHNISMCRMTPEE